MMNGMGVVNTSAVVNAEWYGCSGHNALCILGDGTFKPSLHSMFGKL